MISMTTVDYLQGIMDARFGDELRLGSARLLATGEAMAIVMGSDEIGSGGTLTSILALLKPADAALIDTDGNLTAAAHAAFASLQSAAMEGNNEAWLVESTDGHVDVVFAARDAPVDTGQALITLPWEAPEALFATTTLPPRDTASQDWRATSR